MTSTFYLKAIGVEFLEICILLYLLVTQMYFTVFQMGFQRAARTDKGVSAAGQVVSLKMSSQQCFSINI